MPVYRCVLPGCTFATEDVADGIAAAYLMLHNNEHTNAAQRTAPAVNKQKPPKIDRPRISSGSSEETWNIFTTRWGMFKRGTTLSADETVQQLFECCEEDLGNTILKGHRSAASGTEAELIAIIKKLAVKPIGVSVRRVRRAHLLSTIQGQPVSLPRWSSKISPGCTPASKNSTGVHPCRLAREISIGVHPGRPLGWHPGTPVATGEPLGWQGRFKISLGWA